jgi:small subunit ribosomal protein S2
MTAVVTMKQLLEAGVHFGHQTRRWNPKMKRFIHGERNGIYIIDLQQTLVRIETAYTFVRDLVADGGTILFVGTKRQAQGPVQSYAEKCGMPYINERWLGGMLTNFETMSKRVAKMKEYQRMRDSGEFEAMPKKEALLISRELEKLERNLGGIRDLESLPSAVFILDTKKEHIAVTEANKLKLPIVAVVDTNCDPDVITYVIPGNDDAIRSGTLMCRIIADAVEEGGSSALAAPPTAGPVAASSSRTRWPPARPRLGARPRPRPPSARPAWRSPPPRPLRRARPRPRARPPMPLPRPRARPPMPLPRPRPRDPGARRCADGRGTARGHHRARRRPRRRSHPPGVLTRWPASPPRTSRPCASPPARG